MSGPTYPGGYPTNPSDPNSQPGYPSYPQQPQQPYSQPPTEPPTYQPPYSQPPAYQPPAQPPYSQPPYQQPYSQPPAQPPKKKGGSRVWIVLAIVAAVLIIACVGLCSALGFGAKILGTAASTKVSQLGTQVATQASSVETQVSSADALLTVTTFCQNEQNKEYSSAYSQLSPSLQQQYSQSQFTQDSQQHDSTLGSISACLPQGGVTFSGSTASISIMVTRTPTSNSGTPTASQAGTSTGQITMIQGSNGTWVINSVDSSLNML